MATEQENNKRIAKNTLYMYFRMLITLFVSLFTTRIVFNALGVDDYGIYNIVGSIIVFFTFINNGLVTATRRYITAELATGTPESKNNVFNLAIISHALISIIILVFSETIGLWVVNHLLNIPSDRLFSANIVYQASVFTAIFGVFQAPYMATITAHEKMSVFAYFSIFEVLFKLIVALVVLYTCGDKLITYAVLMMAVAVINQSIYRIYCHRKFEECKFRRPRNRSLLKEMFGFMGWSLVGQGVVVSTNQGVSVLVNMFFNVAANAAMGISNQITNVVTGFVSNFQVAFMPQITKHYVKNEFDELANLAIRSSRISSFLVVIFMLPIVFQIKNILFIWLGEIPLYTSEFCIFTLLGLLIDAMSAPLWMILSADKNIKKYQIVLSTIYTFNFLGGWLLYYMGYPPYSAICVRVVVYIISTFARLKLIEEKVPLFPVKLWLKNVWLRLIKIVAIPVVILFSLRRLEFGNIYIEMVTICSLAVVLTLSFIFLWGLTQGEKEYLKKKFIKLKNRI